MNVTKEHIRHLTTELPRDRTVRGAIALSIGLAVAMLIGGPGTPLLVVGALCSINSDSDASANTRLSRVLAVMAGGTFGVVLGTVAHTPNAWQVAVVALGGLIAGVIGTKGAAGLLGGLKLQILLSIGISLHGVLPLWETVALYLLGCTPMLVMALAHPSRELPVASAWRPDWKRALGLAACVGLASAVAVTIHPAHSWWLPLTAGLVYRVNENRVVYRVLHRMSGTVIGVAVTALIVGFVPYGWPLLLVAAVVGALLPGWTDHAYLLQTMLATICVLALASPGGGGLIEVRLLDTAIACGIVLAFGVALASAGAARSALRPRSGPATRLVS